MRPVEHEELAEWENFAEEVQLGWEALTQQASAGGPMRPVEHEELAEWAFEFFVVGIRPDAPQRAVLSLDDARRAVRAAGNYTGSNICCLGRL